MIIKTNDLLELLSYAGQLDLSTFVRKDRDGDYVVKFYDPTTYKFDETLTIYTGGGADGYSRGTCSFEYLMDTFVGMLKQKEEEKLKAQERQEFLANTLIHTND